jgi:hypothetical protein
MRRLAELTHLRHCPEESPFVEKGAVIGDRDGYLIATGPAWRGSDERAAFSILVRFTELDEPEALKPRLEQLSKDRGWGMKTKVDPLCALWTWKYSLTPKPEVVAERIEAMLTVVKEVAKPLDGRCEVCQMVSAPEITVGLEMLFYQCSGCTERLRLEAEAERQEYDALPGKSARGFSLGLAAALVGGFAWAWVASALGSPWNYLSAYLVGALVSCAVAYGTGKVSRSERILGFILSAVGVVAGYAFYYGSVPQRLGEIVALLFSAGMALFGAYLTLLLLETRFYSRWLLSKTEHSGEKDMPANSQSDSN